MAYQVSEKLTVCSGGRIFPGGELLPDDFPRGEIPRLLREGAVKEVRFVDGPADVARRPRRGLHVQSRWNMDPDGLRGYSLEQLNVLVAERDASVQPFESIPEAVAHLSADFVPVK